ncbi:hypothetical protein SRB5_05430 [Streptomyces sp. RB5]|uniref:HTH merR-type domain-containing protein n=1 Tax=Streptomyces smaragdinus TaxID=2585196 RepID=A0A7K0CAG3_9ACTN|nr:helix-turn-helix domain-containing protein [Streptomyces smaragdinus]MQY10435.1 hypothetical protein [Streptomyces smaragdinus]
MSETTWTIGELAQRAARELRAGSASAGGRVREVPNERLIRWYATIGLVDPPLTRRGRVALYGRRHLLQLVAVKRLQARGRSIAEIQTMLAGATDARLRSVAGPSGDDTPEPEAPGSSPAPRGRFWAAEGRADAAVVRPDTDSSDGPVEWAFTPTVHPAVQLAPGVTLLLAETAPGRPSADDLAALTEAAGPLLAALGRRGLLPPAATDTTPGPARTDSGRSPR